MEYLEPAIIKIPKMRVGVLIGKSGEVKRKIENAFGAKLDVTSEGDVTVTSKDPLALLRAKDVVLAIARGFSPKNAMLLANETNVLDIISLVDYIGKREKALDRIKSRLIGSHGKARFNIEEATKTKISVYGKTIAIIGDPIGAGVARQAIEKLISGMSHKAVYIFLNTRKQFETDSEEKRFEKNLTESEKGVR